jgi:predicted CopG family antitoxin
MANIEIPDELYRAMQKEATDGGYDSLPAYLSRLVRQDQKRRAKEELEALFSDASETRQ